MLKQRAFLLLMVLCYALPAQAGLLEDDEARDHIKQVEARLLKLEQKLEDVLKQQTKSVIDLQSQIDALNTEIRNLRGQNEETTHGLQDAEKRQKDFYVDLDSRLRHFETAEAAAKEAASKAAAVPIPIDSSDPVMEDRSIEAAYSLFKSGNNPNAVKAFQDFIRRYPDSVHLPNAYYWMGNAQVGMKDFDGALDTYQQYLKNYPDSSKAADAMYGMADCQQELKRAVAAHKTLKLLISKYPDSEAAAKARKLLSASK